MGVVSKLLQDQCDFSDTTKEMLRSLKMIPDNTGELVSLTEKVVFFPITDNDSLLNSRKSNSKFL